MQSVHIKKLKREEGLNRGSVIVILGIFWADETDRNVFGHGHSCIRAVQAPKMFVCTRT